MRRQWRNTVARRTYITGGMGSHHHDEAFGADFELPPDRAYSETCAGIASVMLSWRLLLQHGGREYADLIERTLLNNVLASPREDGHAFFYANPLQQRTAGLPPSTTSRARAPTAMRAPWFEVSCCPTNVARTLASVGSTSPRPTALGSSSTSTATIRWIPALMLGSVAQLSVSGGYPFDGAITVRVEAAPTAGATVTLRIPGWARGMASWSVSGGSANATLGDGVLIVSEVVAGDEIELAPCEPRITYPDARIDAVRGSVAIERGPLVLALESGDLRRAMTSTTLRSTPRAARRQLTSEPR